MLFHPRVLILGQDFVIVSPKVMKQPYWEMIPLYWKSSNFCYYSYVFLILDAAEREAKKKEEEENAESAKADDSSSKENKTDGATEDTTPASDNDEKAKG